MGSMALRVPVVVVVVVAAEVEVEVAIEEDSGCSEGGQLEREEGERA